MTDSNVRYPSPGSPRGQTHAVQGIDPVEEGWEYGDLDDLDMAQAVYDQGYLELVASTDLYDGRDAGMLVREDPREWSEYSARHFVRSFLGEE